MEIVSVHGCDVVKKFDVPVSNPFVKSSVYYVIFYLDTVLFFLFTSVKMAQTGNTSQKKGVKWKCFVSPPPFLFPPL